MEARILITGGGTGGHLYPALNLADALRELEPEAELLYVGARRGLEAEVVPERDLRYRLLPVHPLRRSRPLRNWRLLAGAVPSLVGAARALGELDPHAVVGTGGYASGPALVAARIGGRPVVLQEQNARPGLVTRVMARFAAQIHLGFPEARDRLRPGPDTEVHRHGNPVASQDRPPAEPFDWPEGRVVLVAGGSQGARGLNERLLGDLREVRAWPSDLSLVWIAGRDHAEEVASRVERLPWGDRIRVVPYVEELGRQLDAVTLAVSRAGAMFVSELAAAGVPAVLVPFPSAAGGHQGENARALARAGAAVVREESGLSEGDLWRLASRIVADRGRLEEMGRAARDRGAPNAARRIARDVLRLTPAGRAGSGGDGDQAASSGGDGTAPGGPDDPGAAGATVPGGRVGKGVEREG